MISKLPYRLGIGLVIINNQDEVFTGRRLDSTKAWQMPQGGICQALVLSRRRPVKISD